MNLYGPLNVEIKGNDLFSRAINFDPTEVYKRIVIDKHKRYQSPGIDKMFPNEVEGFCACGCGKELSGRQKRWASAECSKFPGIILKIISGDTQLIRRIMYEYLPYNCSGCGREDYLIETKKVMNSGIQVDHIVSIKNGGGGCWLGNYQFLCHTCNIIKEQTDRQIRNKPSAHPVSTLFNL